MEKEVGGAFLSQILTEKDLAFVIDFNVNADLLQDFTKFSALAQGGTEFSAHQHGWRRRSDPRNGWWACSHRSHWPQRHSAL